MKFKLILILGMTLAYLPKLKGQHSPWLNKIDPNHLAADIHALSTTANVRVSDGLTYTATTLYHDRQRAVFQRTYSDRQIASGIDGKYLWNYDGKRETEVPAFYENYILGHQMHAQLLFFDHLHPHAASIRDTSYNDMACRYISDQAPDGNTFTIIFDEWPIAMIIAPPEGSNIVMKLDSFQSADGFVLPFFIEIDDGERIFNYHFQSIQFNQEQISRYRCPYERLSDEQKLLRLHRRGMDAHLWEDAETIKATLADTLMVANSGEVSYAPASMMDGILGSRDYTLYEDLIRPIVKVSNDGSLGWVTVQIKAKGFRFDEQQNPTIPLEFVSAWAALFEKQEGHWRMIGNVSNFKSL